MRCFAALLLTFAIGSRAEEPSGPERCWARCTQYLSGRERDRVCQTCLPSPDEAAWMLGLRAVPPGALQDPDWQVRWGALRLDARLKGVTPQRRLGSWVSTSAGDERVIACLTAVHVAGAAEAKLGTWLSAAKTGDPSAASACAAQSAALVRALEPDLFEPSSVTRTEALEHLAVALDIPPARLVLDAIRSRPPTFDRLIGDALINACERRGLAAGRSLLEVATADDTTQVNRLLTGFSAMRDAEREKLAAPEVLDRLAAVHVLAPLAPLSDPELTQALLDTSAQVRVAAARALARGENHSLDEATLARLDGTVVATSDDRVRWLHLLGEASSAACASTALFAFNDASQPDDVRGAGLEVAAMCAPGTADELTRRAAASSKPVEQTAALRAAAYLPKSPFVVELVSRGLSQNEPTTLVAATRAASTQHLTHLGPLVERLASHTSPAVRAEALKALPTVSPSLARQKAASALEKDPAEEVRIAAASALGRVGGVQALHALTMALEDASPRVKFVAADSLRRLGNGSVQP